MPTLAELAAKKGFTSGVTIQTPASESGAVEPKSDVQSGVDSGTTADGAGVGDKPKFLGFGKKSVATGGHSGEPVVASPSPDSAGDSAGGDSPAATTDAIAATVTESTSPESAPTPPPSGGAQGLARLAGLQNRNAPTAEPVPESATGTYSLADIEDMDAGVGIEAGPIYSDMIPAQMPDRELPEDLTQGQQDFVDLVSGLYTCMNDPQMFSNVIRNFMQELQSNPEYDKLIVDADVNAMMGGLRSSMGMAKIKKAEKSTTRSKKPAKAPAMGSTLDSMFDDADFD